MVDMNEQDLRIAVRAWLAKTRDHNFSLLERRTLLVVHKWAVRPWPDESFGRGYPAWADNIVRSELLSAGSVSTPAKFNCRGELVKSKRASSANKYLDYPGYHQ